MAVSLTKNGLASGSGSVIFKIVSGNPPLVLTLNPSDYIKVSSLSRGYSVTNSEGNNE